jgi:hypothetical protein
LEGVPIDIGGGSNRFGLGSKKKCHYDKKHRPKNDLKGSRILVIRGRERAKDNKKHESAPNGHGGNCTIMVLVV